MDDVSAATIGERRTWRTAERFGPSVTLTITIGIVIAAALASFV